ncbi:hypothetical protein D3C80_1902860 [compost metagenome]
MAQDSGRHRSLRGKAIQVVRPWFFLRDAGLGQFFVQRFVAGDEDGLFLLRDASVAFAPIVAAMIGTDDYQPVFPRMVAAPFVDLVQQLP